MTVFFVLFVVGMWLWIMYLLQLPPFFHRHHYVGDAGPETWTPKKSGIFDSIPSSAQLIKEWEERNGE